MIYLASQSPRRKQLMELLGKEFIVKPTNVEENVPKNITPKGTVEYLSLIKAEELYDEIKENDIIIGADTVVVFENEIFGKPTNDNDAVNMLKRMSGKIHTVITGITIIKKTGEGKKVKTFSCKTDVKFYHLSDTEIADYVATGEPKDKAGAYGIQEKGSLFVEKIDGDFFNVVGLPVSALSKELDKLFWERRVKKITAELKATAR